MVVSRDKKEALVGYYQILAKPNEGLKRLVLKGLIPDEEYMIDGVEQSFYGDELMNFGVILNRLKKGKRTSGDFSAFIFPLKSKV